MVGPGVGSAGGSAAECGRRCWARVAQEVRAANSLVVLANGGCGQPEGVQAAQESAIWLVLPRDRAVALPPGAPKLVERPVVSGSGVCVSGDGIVGREGAIGQRRPPSRV